jgi:Flp pilus assembly protein TadG
MTHHPSRDETGSAPVVELVLGAPLLALLISLVVWAGTGGQTPGEVSVAAHDGARLASTIREPASRPAAVRGLVDRQLPASPCLSWTVDTVSTTTLVTVTVVCTLDTPQMVGLQLGPRAVSITARSTIDPYFTQADR